ncbi:MAG: protein kinase [Myxococcales bacterium]|nr:protein kinase [Myxococcales bacterium]
MSFWRRLLGRFRRKGDAGDEHAVADENGSEPAASTITSGEIGEAPAVQLDDEAFGISSTPDFFAEEEGDEQVERVPARRRLIEGLRAATRRDRARDDDHAHAPRPDEDVDDPLGAGAEVIAQLRDVLDGLVLEYRERARTAGGGATSGDDGWLVDERAARDTRDIIELVDRIAAAGQRTRALELLDRAVQMLPGLAALRLELAERLYERQRFADATELLYELALPADHAMWRHAIAVRAHFLLGDYYRREADPRRALQSYEAVLARDFNYPRARARAESLRAQLDRPLGSAAPTILGAEQVDSSGRYVIERELGRGGGGTVYLARDRSVDRPVALKVLHAHVAKQAEARAHLFCEARIAASLHHPRIVTIYDLDEDKNLVVMEYCAGGTLAQRIAAGPLPLDQALDALAQVSGVLDAAHRAGVVHRDLKPANLLRRMPTAGGGIAPIVLTDFGIAHVHRGEASEGDDIAAGTRAYMAPELRRGAPADARVDLYALGVILVEMLLGRRPLDDRQALAGVIPHELPELWRELSDVTRDEGVVALARRLLAPDPAQRLGEAHEARAEALALRHHERLAAVRRGVYAELERRAGPAPDAPARAWLEHEAQQLLSPPSGPQPPEIA